MPHRRRFLKPIDQLRPQDLEGRPFWRFAENAEGLPGQDETSVEPVPLEELPLSDPLFAVADLSASDGTQLVGLVELKSDQTGDVLLCAIITSDAYAPLPERGDRMADSLVRYSEGKLGFSLKQKFPIAYRVRGPLRPDASPLCGTFSFDAIPDA
jgi:hypothetical protein